MTSRFLLLFVALWLLLSASPVRAFTDSDLIDGFLRTVFGSEYPPAGWQAGIVKKFAEPVRVYVDDRSSAQRTGEIKDFVRTLPGLIRGLKVVIVSNPGEANYRIFVLDRADYRRVVSQEIYGRTTSSHAPGKCLVRVVASSTGIIRSDAAIVADDGDYLFRRCLVEEVLQGLGPVNDDRTLRESVFNDRSRQTTFTDFDQHILNMLYDPMVEPGMTINQVIALLPAVTARVRARLD